MSKRNGKKDKMEKTKNTWERIVIAKDGGWKNSGQAGDTMSNDIQGNFL